MPFASERDKVIAQQILLLLEQEITASVDTQNTGTARRYRLLIWLLRANAMNGALRRERRHAYLSLVRQLDAEFRAIYRERLSVAGPWNFAEICALRASSRRLIRRMRWNAVLHLLRFNVDRRSYRAFRELKALFPRLQTNRAS